MARESWMYHDTKVGWSRNHVSTRSAFIHRQYCLLTVVSSTGFADDRRVGTFCFAPRWSAMLNQYLDLPLAGLDRFVRPVRKIVRNRIVRTFPSSVPRARDASFRERDALADKSFREAATAHLPFVTVEKNVNEESGRLERFTIVTWTRVYLSFCDFTVRAIRMLTSVYYYHKNNRIFFLSLRIRLTN